MSIAISFFLGSLLVSDLLVSDFLNIFFFFILCSFLRERKASYNRNESSSGIPLLLPTAPCLSFLHIRVVTHKYNVYSSDILTNASTQPAPNVVANPTPHLQPLENRLPITSLERIVLISPYSICSF